MLSGSCLRFVGSFWIRLRTCLACVWEMLEGCLGDFGVFFGAISGVVLAGTLDICGGKTTTVNNTHV